MSGRKSNRRRPTQVRKHNPGQVLRPRDFNTQRIRVPPSPPSRNATPVCMKVVRVFANWTSAGSVAYLYSITPNLLAVADQLDYGSLSLRYQYVRLQWVKIWVGSSGYTPSASPPTGGASYPQSVSLISSSGTSDPFEFVDQAQPGVDFSTIGVRMNIQNTAAWVGTTTVVPWMQVQILADPALTVGNTICGALTIDAMVAFR